MFKIRQTGIMQLQNQLSDGLEAVAERLLAVSKATAPVETIRDPAFTRDTLHTDKTHSREWPRPAVFVATASGDGFFVHEGTVDTPAYPFLSQALDSIQRQIPGIIRSRTNLGRRGARTEAFKEINASLPDYLRTHRAD